jgi:hypothetical protein
VNVIRSTLTYSLRPLRLVPSLCSTSVSRSEESAGRLLRASASVY